MKIADELLAALKAAKGYMLNAVIDLQTGAPKKTACDTLDGGIRLVSDAISKAEDRNFNLREQGDSHPDRTKVTDRNRHSEGEAS